MRTIAFVGAGPTTIYTLRALVAGLDGPAAVTIYEEQARAGLGTPYRPGWNDPAMLSNIASIEIPPIEETLVAWLKRQPRTRLLRLGVDPDAIDPEAFYPRLALGEYFLDQFHATIERARATGLTIEIVTRCRIGDIAPVPGGFRLLVEPTGDERHERVFEQVVIATGHAWPEEPEVRPGYFLSPWPATALQRIRATTISIRGSSLTAIDAVVALSVTHGDFIEQDSSETQFRIAEGSEALRMVMMSRKGLLPEADFFHPVPYEPLSICTPEAITELVEARCNALLDRSFELFKAELAQTDPDYADRIGLDDVTLEEFADRYFEDRTQADAFDWAEHNLAEARENYERRYTVPWRYAILRMHEVFALIVPHLDEEALRKFDRHLKPIFVDEYATVPHLSIERLLALHRTGHLDVMALGHHHTVDTRGDKPGAVVTVDGKRRHFPVLIDAIGQRPLAVDAFPFQSLLDDGVVLSATDDEAKGPKGVSVDESFNPASDHLVARHLFILSIPFLLSRHPFIQGITSSHEMGEIVGAALARGPANHPVRLTEPAEGLAL